MGFPIMQVFDGAFVCMPCRIHVSKVDKDRIGNGNVSTFVKNHVQPGRMHDHDWLRFWCGGIARKEADISITRLEARFLMNETDYLLRHVLFLGRHDRSEVDALSCRLRSAHLVAR